MKYRLLGNSGLRVSELCFGTMTFGEDWGYGAPDEECRAMFDLFLESGGNFIDTANRYTEGTSERFLGEYIQPVRNEVVLATKYSLTTAKRGINDGGNHRKNLVQSVEGSLSRLRTDYIDLLYLHAWDFTTPVEEVMRALDDLVRSGKVLYVGISDTPAWIVSRANAIAELRGWTPFIALQIEYSLLQRAPERDLVPMAQALDIGVVAWAPLAGGALTGKYLHAGDQPKRLKEDSKRLNERNRGIAEEVVAVAADIGCPPAHVALNWLRRKSGVIPLIGARSVYQLEENLRTLDSDLTDGQMQRLDQVSAIEPGFPHDFLAGDAVRDMLFGGKAASLIHHRRR